MIPDVRRCTPTKRVYGHERWVGEHTLVQCHISVMPAWELGLFASRFELQDRKPWIDGVLMEDMTREDASLIAAVNAGLMSFLKFPLEDRVMPDKSLERGLASRLLDPLWQDWRDAWVKFWDAPTTAPPVRQRFLPAHRQLPPCALGLPRRDCIGTASAALEAWVKALEGILDAAENGNWNEVDEKRQCSDWLLECAACRRDWLDGEESLKDMGRDRLVDVLRAALKNPTTATPVRREDVRVTQKSVSLMFGHGRDQGITVHDKSRLILDGRSHAHDADNQLDGVRWHGFSWSFNNRHAEGLFRTDEEVFYFKLHPLDPDRKLHAMDIVSRFCVYYSTPNEGVMARISGHSDFGVLEVPVCP